MMPASDADAPGRALAAPALAAPALAAPAVAGAARLPIAKTAATAAAIITRLRCMFSPARLILTPAFDGPCGQHLSGRGQNDQFLITPAGRTDDATVLQQQVATVMARVLGVSESAIDR